MARLHIRFRKIHKRVINHTQRLFDSKPWAGSEEDQQTKFETWLRAVSEVYGIPQPTLSVDTMADRWGLVAPNTIVLTKYSVTSMFHSFRAHMQYTGAVDVAFYDMTDAQAWACSLYYTCRPILFRKAVRDGRIWGVSPNDLLTSASLAARQDEVDEAFAGIVAESYDDAEIEDGEAEVEDEVPTTSQMQAASFDEQISVAEAATMLGVSSSTVRNMLRDGRLAEVREGRTVRVTRESVVARMG